MAGLSTRHRSGQSAAAPRSPYDSTQFLWTNPRTGGKQQMSSVLAAGAVPPAPGAAGCRALAAAPSDDEVAWEAFLDRRSGRPELVVYDSDKAIHSAVRRKWPTVPIHLLRAPPVRQRQEAPGDDGQEGWGNTYRTLLAAAGQSPEGWAAFRNAVLGEPTLTATGAWVRHWDQQMAAQTARRASMPPHYSTAHWTRTSPPSANSWNDDGGPSATCPG